MSIDSIGMITNEHCRLYYQEKEKLLEEKKQWKNPPEQIKVRYENEKIRLQARMFRRILHQNQSYEAMRVKECHVDK